jgi:hypothetical protein
VLTRTGVCAGIDDRRLRAQEGIEAFTHALRNVRRTGAVGEFGEKVRDALLDTVSFTEEQSLDLGPHLAMSRYHEHREYEREHRLSGIGLQSNDRTRSGGDTRE